MSEFEQVIKEGAQSVGKRARRLLIWLLFLGIVVLAGYFAVCNFTYSKGILLKTFEGTLNTGGLAINGQGGAVSTNWDFSVWDREVYKELDDLQGEKVKLYYRQKLKAMPWQGMTDYFVYKVERVK
jgi:hypothetical protein